MKQRTIKKEVIFSGKALQTGKHVDVICAPAGAGQGITFTRTDIKERPSINLAEMMLSPGQKRRSTIGMGKVQVQTVEHFLAAVWSLGIDNLDVEISAPELPAMDGSSLGFLLQLKEAGIMGLDAEREYIKITDPVEASDGEGSVSVVPADSFSVSYFIDYDVKCIGKGEYHFDPEKTSFEEEIAPARTFCLMREALILFLTGLGRGATMENTLILRDKGPLGTRFRMEGEPVRHKVLDLIGDLYMLGRPIIGRVVAKKSGHALNGELIKKISEKYL